jgi:hypothetical protein
VRLAAPLPGDEGSVPWLILLVRVGGPDKASEKGQRKRPAPREQPHGPYLPLQERTGGPEHS